MSADVIFVILGIALLILMGRIDPNKTMSRNKKRWICPKLLEDRRVFGDVEGKYLVNFKKTKPNKKNLPLPAKITFKDKNRVFIKWDYGHSCITNRDSINIFKIL